MYRPEDIGPEKTGLRFEIPKSMVKFFVLGPRYRVVYGGRGSVKSWTIARALLVLGCKRKLRILCAREFQKSIRESVHYLLKSQVDRLGLNDEYVIQDTRIFNRWTGTEFIFVGLHHNVTSLKSMEAVDICWIEEAETVSRESWDILDPTIRKPGSEIWISFNPREETDPIYQMFAIKEKRMPGAVVVEVGWVDNPWLPEELRVQAEYMRANDIERYEHVWGGKTWFKNDAQVLSDKWGVKEIDIAKLDVERLGGPYFGADWGFSQDPTALVKSYVEVIEGQLVADSKVSPDKMVPASIRHLKAGAVKVPLRRNLIIKEEAFATGCEIMQTPALFDTVSESRQYRILADNARPETISHMKGVGFKIEPCEKWKGSVEDGVTYLRGFERIYIDPSCTRMQEEARLWSYVVDKLTQTPTRKLRPGYDHGWDGVRYGHQDMITRTNRLTIFDVV